MNLYCVRSHLYLALLLASVSVACGDENPTTMPTPIDKGDPSGAGVDAAPGVNPIAAPSKACYITELRSNSDNTTRSLGESATIERDAEGRPVKVEIDEDLDGMVDQTYTYTFDENGNVSLLEWDTDADGVVDGSSTHTNTYDGEKLVQVEYEPIPCCPAARQTYTWDGDEVKTRVRENLVGDNKRVTFTDTLTYEDGVLVSRESLYSGSGGTRWSYGEDGNLLEERTISSAGSVSKLTTYSYDEQGNLISVSEDTDGDGEVDVVDTYTNTYELGRLVQIDLDEDSDETIDEIWTYTYEMNVLVRIDFDHNLDGMPEGSEVFGYMDGRVNYHSKNYNGDGFKEIEDEYDANGYPTRRFRDFASTGKFMVYEEYEYMCVDEALWWPDFEFPVSILSSLQ